MKRDWGIKDKIATVRGKTPLAEAIRRALVAEGASIADSGTGPTDILVTVPDALHVTDDLDIGVDAGKWSERMQRLFEEPRRITHDMLPAMMDRGYGRIIHLIGSFEPMSFNAQFAAWGAMAAWSKSLTRVVGDRGPTLNLIQAGQFADDAGTSGGGSAEHIPAGRFCTADDISPLVVFLCSPYARYLTGTVIPVDGGLRRYQN